MGGASTSGSSSATSVTTGTASTTVGGATSASTTMTMTTTTVTSTSGGFMNTSTTVGPSGTGTTAATGAGGTGTGSTSTDGSSVVEGETGPLEGIVAAHNQARAEVDTMPPLGDLVWSDDLAAVAQDWADNLTSPENCGNIFHRQPNMYGENIAMRGGFGNFDPFTGPDAVSSWVAEIDCWTYGTIGQSEQCDQQCVSALNASGCGHYTQVVWDDTDEVGCGYASCTNGNSTVEVIVCNYDPPGNYIGQTPY